MTGYFAGAGFSSESGPQPAYQNKSRAVLKRWRTTGLIVGGLIEVTMFFVLLRVEYGLNEMIVTFADPQSAGWLWLGIGAVLFGVGVVCAAGVGVINALAYDQQFRFGPMPETPVGAPIEERMPRLDDVSRPAGTDSDPIPVTDNFLR